MKCEKHYYGGQNVGLQYYEIQNDLKPLVLLHAQAGLLMAALNEDDLQCVLDLVPNCFLVRFDCGHAIHIEKPREFVSALLTMA